MVLLQSCEQVPKRKHSLISGNYTGGSWAYSSWCFCSPCPHWSHFPTLASRLPWHSVEACTAGTVSSFLASHTACLIPTDAGVSGAAGQLGVCGGTESGSPSLSPSPLQCPPCCPCRPGLPIMQSSSSEPSPQSSNMLQRREEDRQRWFRHRNSFLSLQWAVWAVGGSRDGQES